MVILVSAMRGIIMTWGSHSLHRNYSEKICALIFSLPYRFYAYYKVPVGTLWLQ